MGSVAGCGSSGYGLCWHVLEGKYVFMVRFSRLDFGLVCLLLDLCRFPLFWLSSVLEGCSGEWSRQRMG